MTKEDRRARRVARKLRRSARKLRDPDLARLEQNREYFEMVPCGERVQAHLKSRAAPADRAALNYPGIGMGNRY